MLPIPKLRLRATWHTLALITMLGAMWYAAEAQSNGAAHLLAMLTGIVALLSILHARANLSGLRMQVRAAPTVREGNAARLRIELRNDSTKPVHSIEVQIIGSTSCVFIERLESGQPRIIELLTPPQHHSHTPLRVLARSVYPLGLYSLECVMQARGLRRVHPRPAGTLPLPAAAQSSGQAPLSSSSSTTITRGGDDFAGLREWQRGDSPRHIDWRAFARGRPLMVKVWSAVNSAVVIIDWDAIPLDESARASQIARWIDECEATEQPYSLKLPTLTIPAGRGESQQRRCLDSLADFITQSGTQSTTTGSNDSTSTPQHQHRTPSTFENSSRLPPGPLLLLCIALATAMVPLIDSIAPPCILLAALCFIYRGVLRRSVPHIAIRVLVLLTGGLATWLSYPGAASMEAGIALLITLAGAKLLESRTPREFQVLALIGWFLCLSGIIMDNGLTRMLWCLGAFVLITTCMVRFRLSAPGFARPMRVTGTLIAQALPLVAILFFIFPRGLLDLNSAFGSRAGETGISDNLDPGSITRMTLRMDKAFRVEFPDGVIPTNDQRYWRCLTLWGCNGMRWQRGVYSSASPAATPLIPANDVKQIITLEPNGARWLPALDIPLQIEALNQSIPVEFDDTFRSPFTINNAIRFTAISRPYARQFVELPHKHRDAALQLPADLPASMHALVATWKYGAVSDREIMFRAIDHLKTQGFIYTLTPDEYTGPIALEDFMVRGRNGFCEHFSASFATLMRMAGIPSRVVVGYLGGEYSEETGSMIIRQSDAHAWVELWLNGSGWSRIDPTAALAPDRVNTSIRDYIAGGSAERDRQLATWWGYLTHQSRVIWDRLNYAWQDRVVEFDQDSQRSWLSRLNLSRITTAHLLIISGSVLTLAAFLISLWHRRRTQHADPWSRAWQHLCQKLAKSGHPARLPSEGPLAYIQRIGTTDPVLHCLAQIYANGRYGHATTTAIDFSTQIKRLKLTRVT